MLKFDQLKLRTAVKQCQAFFSLIDPFDILAKHGELTLALHPMKIPDCWFGGVRLVVNQSVVPVDLESLPED